MLESDLRSVNNSRWPLPKITKSKINKKKRIFIFGLNFRQLNIYQNHSWNPGWQLFCPKKKSVQCVDNTALVKHCTLVFRKITTFWSDKILEKIFFAPCARFSWSFCKKNHGYYLLGMIFAKSPHHFFFCVFWPPRLQNLTVDFGSLKCAICKIGNFFCKFGQIQCELAVGKNFPPKKWYFFRFFKNFEKKITFQRKLIKTFWDQILKGLCLFCSDPRWFSKNFSQFTLFDHFPLNYPIFVTLFFMMRNFGGPLLGADLSNSCF